MEQNRRAESQVALIRWIGLAVAALMLWDGMPLRFIGIGVALVAAYNAALTLVAASPDRYARWGRRLSVWACGADILIISGAVSLGKQGGVLYPLYALAIIGAGYVSMRPRHIAWATLGSLAGFLAAMVTAHPHAGLQAWAIRAGMPCTEIAAAALVAGLLLIYKQRDDTMLRRDRQLSTLLEFGMRFTSGEDAARVMEQTLRAAIRNTDATAAYIMLANETGDTLTTEVALNMDEERPFPTTRAFGEGIEGYVAQTGKPLGLTREIDNAGSPDKAVSAAAPNVHYDGEAILCIPMIENGTDAANEVIGVFTVIHHRAGHQFLDEDIELIRTLAGLATMAIINSRLYEGLRSSFIRSLQTLAKTLDAKDAYTQGHSFRVSELCVMIARKLRVAPDVVEDLRNGALLHDVGKIGIPDAILRKPERLTDAEFEVMKQHPVIGYDICKPLGLSDAILMLIRNHHEKLDGTGYPDGLKMGELPLPLRIICVADAFDAMSSSRPYRKVMDSRVRNEQLNRFAGTQFDPVIIETLKSLLSSGELDALYKDHWRQREPEKETAEATEVEVEEKNEQRPLLRVA